MADVILLPLPREEDLHNENLRAIAAFALAVVAVRAAPQTLAVPGRVGLGLRVTPGAPSPVGPSFLTVTNLLPQPFGFVPAKNYGLSSNFYIPPGVEDSLPDFLPGVKEQTAQRHAEREAAVQAQIDERNRARDIILNNFGDDALRRLRDVALSPEGAVRFADPQRQVQLIDAELLRRAVQTDQSNAVLAAGAATRAVGAVAVADNQNVLPNAFPNGQQASNTPNAGVGVINALAPTVINAPQFLPSGFVEVPLQGQIGTSQIPPGANTPESDTFTKKVNKGKQGSFLDTLFSLLNGDP